ncbi:hypothetical protein TNCV_4882081, partial [Trichonephila clavipes]
EPGGRLNLQSAAFRQNEERFPAKEPGAELVDGTSDVLGRQEHKLHAPAFPGHSRPTRSVLYFDSFSSSFHSMRLRAETALLLAACHNGHSDRTLSAAVFP